MRKLFSGAFTVVVLAIFLFLIFVALTRAQTTQIVATGGSFVLEKTVVAGGGREKQTVTVAENGTTGQALAGITSTGGPYSIYSGFWTADQLAPTAAGVMVGGRIATADGTGIRNVYVSLTYPTGEIRTALSSSLGYYSFDEVPAGETYILSVSAKRFTFAEPTRILHVVDEIADADFIAQPHQNRFPIS